jgi:hypothetical protein
MSPLVAFALVCFVAGVLAMIVLEVIWLGVILLFAFIVAGVFAIADPDFLGADDGGEPARGAAEAERH